MAARGGLNSNDIVGGLDGDDRLYGQAGNDYLNGGRGADDLRGGADDDRLFGLDGSHHLYGGRDYDTLVGGTGSDDLLDGSAGRDNLCGGGRNRLLYDAADSHIRGDAGEDTLIVDGSVNPPSDVWRQDEAGAVDIGGQHYTRWEFGDSALFIDADSALNNVVDNGEHGVFT